MSTSVLILSGAGFSDNPGSGVRGNSWSKRFPAKNVIALLERSCKQRTIQLWSCPRGLIRGVQGDPFLFFLQIIIGD